MRSSLFCVALLALFATTLALQSAPDYPQDDRPFEFVISLDDAPRDRWRAAMKAVLAKQKWEVRIAFISTCNVILHGLSDGPTRACTRSGIFLSTLDSNPETAYEDCRAVPCHDDSRLTFEPVTLVVPTGMNLLNPHSTRTNPS